MTELCGASHCTPAEGKTKFGSVGLLLPNLQCKVSSSIASLREITQHCLTSNMNHPHNSIKHI